MERLDGCLDVVEVSPRDGRTSSLDANGSSCRLKLPGNPPIAALAAAEKRRSMEIHGPSWLHV